MMKYLYFASWGRLKKFLSEIYLSSKKDPNKNFEKQGNFFLEWKKRSQLLAMINNAISNWWSPI